MRRRRGGGAKPQDRILRFQIESARKNYPTVEQLAGHLHLSCRYYTREDRQSFTNRVSKIIQVSSRRKDAMDDFNDDDGGTPIIKKRRKIEEEEEKLRIIEAQHVKRRHNDVLNDTGAGRMASAGSLGGGGTSDEEESTSVDTIYGEKFVPEYDLMKSMIREKLLQKSKKSGDEREVKEAVELEVVGKKGVKEVHLMNEEGKLGGLSKINKDDNSGKGGNKINKNDNIGKHGNKINGPTFKDLGGMSGVIEELKRKVIVPLCQLRLLRHLGSEPMAGLLLHGPPGCGKTKLAQAIANETGLPFYKTSATELMSAVPGAPEENIRELFSKAYRTAPSIVFIDEIDAIASKREDLQRKMECRIVTQLMTCMDESYKLVEPIDDNAGSESSDCRLGYVLVIGATNRPDAIDPSLRMPGRFDREIVLSIPNECARVEILAVLKSKLKVEDAFDLVKIARLTPGFVGSDLAGLSREAVNLAMMRILDKREVELSKERTDGAHSKDWYKQPLSDEEMEKASITMADFEEACKMVQPSFRREGFSTIPNVKWNDVGGLHLLRKEFDRYIIRRIKFPEYYEDLGLDLETGFLLYGPPGCGKTLIAKALANEAGANFIHIKGPELLSKYVGESELAVRTIFSRARTCSPCIMFFDEVDALTTNRGKEGGWVVERVLNQLLIELDGAEQRRGVYVIGATNRPEVMDRALLRPGRFGKLLYVPLPSAEERGLILKALARNKSIDANVDFVALGKDGACENLSGADLAALMNEAGMVAMEDLPTSSCRITIKDAHFKRALEKISPSVSNEQIEYYKLLSKSLKAA